MKSARKNDTGDVGRYWLILSKTFQRTACFVLYKFLLIHSVLIFCRQWSIRADQSSHEGQPRPSWEHTADAELPEGPDHSATVQGELHTPTHLWALCTLSWIVFNYVYAFLRSCCAPSMRSTRCWRRSWTGIPPIQPLHQYTSLRNSPAWSPWRETWSISLVQTGGRGWSSLQPHTDMNRDYARWAKRKSWY